MFIMRRFCCCAIFVLLMFLFAKKYLKIYFRWKEKAGTMFRELNRMRNEYRLCDAERRELRVQLIMIKGELGLAQCQLAELSTRRERGSVFLTPIQKTKSPKSPTVGTSSSDRRSVRDVSSIFK